MTMSADKMYEKTIFSINTEKMAKESLSIVMEEMQKMDGLN